MSIPTTEGSMVEYSIVDDRSDVTLSGKSSLHPIHGVLRPGNLAGYLKARRRDGRIDPSFPLIAHLEIPILALSFGNTMYDRELPKRVHAEDHPLITIDLDGVAVEDPDRWRLRLTVSAHGTQQTVEEVATVGQLDDELISFRGSHRFDITEFGLKPPKMLGMKVHPDFEVSVDIVGQPTSEKGQVS